MRKNLLSGISIFVCISILVACGSKPSGPLTEEAGQDSIIGESAPAASNEDPADAQSALSSFSSAGEDIHLRIDANTTSLDESYDISDLLYGIFLEDINYSVDGGLYAEMVKNRSFEYGSYAADGHAHGWLLTDSEAVTLQTVNGSVDGTALHANNPTYAIVTNVTEGPQGISNHGFLDGMAVEGGAGYRFSAFLKGLDGYQGSIVVRLADTTGKVYAESSIEAISDSWMQYEIVLTPSESANANLSLDVLIGKGSVAMDMVSLFPTDTYNGRKNGLRKDLVEYLAALHPAFLRFPGGCAVEGMGTDSIYRWKDSIGNGEKLVINGVETVGDVAVRPQATGVWGESAADPYYRTYGLGFYEYFLLCEDLGCLGVPVLNAGMTCPDQSGQYLVYDVDSEEFAQCVQDALDLVEFCRGGQETTWGAIRIAMGHPQPFELRYICIGNAQWQAEYYEHFEKFQEAFDNAALKQPQLYQDIELIVANGSSSLDRHAWDLVRDDPQYAGLVDERYEEAPSWFLNNVDRYDSYDRQGTPVSIGGYAGKSNSLETALSEAAFLTGLERNGDLVEMSCYAPLFGNETSNQKSPDLIWFNNNSVYGSADYYVQKLFMNNAGSIRLPAELTGVSSKNSLAGKVGLGSWTAEASFDDLRVVSNSTGEVLYEEDFSDAPSQMEAISGNFLVENGVLTQSLQEASQAGQIGNVAYFGNASWQDYTLTVKAVKVEGEGGFLIPIAVTGQDDNLFWDLCAQDGSVSCLQSVSAGEGTGPLTGTSSSYQIEPGVTYDLKVEVGLDRVKCYVNDELLIDYVAEPVKSIYQSSCLGEDGSLILKLVNITGFPAPIAVTIDHFDGFQPIGALQVVSGSAPSAINSLQEPENVTMINGSIEVGEDFVYTLPPYSASVIRIPATVAEPAAEKEE